MQVLLGSLGSAQPQDKGAIVKANRYIRLMQAEDFLGTKKEAKAQEKTNAQVWPTFMAAKFQKGLEHFPRHRHRTQRGVFTLPFGIPLL